MLRTSVLLVSLFASTGALGAASAAESGAREKQADATVKMLFAADGVRKGLSLHLECADGVLTAVLRRNGAHVVHGI